MIAIDTNVLLRYLLNDDAAQAAKASRVIRSNVSVLISNVVLVETVWTLTGKKYKLNAEAIARVVRALFEEPTVTFENPRLVWQSLSDFQVANALAPERVEFPDALILNIGKMKAAAMNEAFEGFFTFDAAARKLPGARVP